MFRDMLYDTVHLLNTRILGLKAELFAEEEIVSQNIISETGVGNAFIEFVHGVNQRNRVAGGFRLRFFHVRGCR